jgi:hypothetical protein
MKNLRCINSIRIKVRPNKKGFTLEMVQIIFQQLKQKQIGPTKKLQGILSIIIIIIIIK